MKDIYVLENDSLSIKVTSLGATLMSLYDKTKKQEITLGFDTVDEYIDNRGIFFGATVGRCANRIGNGRFCLNGKEYNVLVNNGPNSLHGGSVQFSFEEFELIEKNDDSITFKYFSKDGEAGYPGNLTLYVTYRIETNKLYYEISGSSDKDTIFNITNHSYFNLSGGKNDSLQTEIKIPASEVCVNDKDGMATSIRKDVTGTVYDFREYKKLENIIEKDDNLALGGLDHNFVYEDTNDKLVCSIRNENILLNVYSDLPNVQVYTSDFFDSFKGRNGITYKKYWGIAIEPQYCPNAINYDGFLKPIIKANKEVEHHIVYEVI